MDSPGTIWDYSQVPAHEWAWRIDEYEEITVRITSRGLVYQGDHGFWGGFSAGFQSFDAFFSEGPLNQMTESIEAELRAYLTAHRREGGAHLEVFLIIPPELPIWRAFLGFNGPTINPTLAPPAGQERVWPIFSGPLEPGEQLLNWAIIFLLPLMDAKSGEIRPLHWIVYGKCRFTVVLGRQQVRLEVFRGAPDPVGMRAFLGDEELALFDFSQRRYTAVQE